MALAQLVALACAGLAVAAPTGSTFTVSRPGAGTLVAPNDGASGAPLAVSDDGRYVAFLSTADGFAPGANPSVVNLFVRDTVAKTTVLASRSDGLNGVGVNANVDSEDRGKIGIIVQPGSAALDAPHDQAHVIVVFSTKASNLVDHATHSTPATAGVEQVWMRDVTAGTTYLVSWGNAEGPGDGRSWQPSIAASSAGPLVAFASEATDVGDDASSLSTSSVYMREMNRGLTRKVSCSERKCPGRVPLGPSSEPSIQFVSGLKGPQQNELCFELHHCAIVAFSTADPSIAPAASWINTQVVTARALASVDGNEIEGFHIFRTSSAAYGLPDVEGDGPSWAPQVAPHGAEVVFLSHATNLGSASVSPEVTEGWAHWHIEDTTPFLTFGLNPGGSCCAPANANVRHISIGGGVNSQVVGFDTVASNMGVPVPEAGRPRGFVREGNSTLVVPDRGAGAEGALGDGESSNVTISADGRYAVFASNSTNLGAGGGAEFSRIYKRSIRSSSPDYNSLELVSRSSGTGSFSTGSRESRIVSKVVSSDGRFVAFQSKADDLSSADDDRFTNVFVRDTVSGTTTLVSRANGASGATADADSEVNGISDDGQRVLFTSFATNLGATGQPGSHPYVRDLAAGTTTVVSRANGSTGKTVPGTGLAISGNGARVAFSTWLAVDPEAADGSTHLFLRDMGAQTTMFVDRGNGEFGTPAESGPLAASLDKTGNRVAWETTATLAAGDGATRDKIYLRDIAAKTTVLVSRADGKSGASANDDSLNPAIDAAGDTVAFESRATNLGEAGPDRAIWVRQVATGNTELVSRATGATGAPANEVSFGPVSIDAAGERVTFLTHSPNLLSQDVGQTPVDAFVFVRDIKAKTTEAVNRVNGANGALASPAAFGQVSISGNGDCVAFTSRGANFGDTYASPDFLTVRERVVRGSCGPAQVPLANAGDVAEAPREQPAATAPALLSELEASPAVFSVGANGGTEISFVLSERAPVSLKFSRLAGGRSESAGAITVHGVLGANTIEFSGRVNGRSLAPGRYRWTATPRGGEPAAGRFQITKAPSRRPARRHP